MRNPLSLVAILYAGGLVLGHFIPAPWEWLLAAALGLALLALGFDRLGRDPAPLPRTLPPTLSSSEQVHGKVCDKGSPSCPRGFPHNLSAGVAFCRRYTLVVLLPIAGWANLAVQTAVHSPHDLRKIIGTNAAYVTIRGTLLASPTLRLNERSGRVFPRSSVEIDVAALQDGDTWSPALGRVAATTPGVLGVEFFSGREVEVTGVIQSPRGPMAPGQLDYRGYLESRGVFYQLRSENTNDWRLSAKGAKQKPAFTDRFARWALRILGMGLDEDQSLRLVWAMVLGWKTGLTPEVAEVFMQSGTLHIFAISGMHIALIAGILVSLLRVLRVTRGASGLVVIPLIWFYTAATGWQASAVRSTIMMTLVIGGWALERPGNLINSLAAAGLIILAWDPAQLFQAGFQLSFFVVLAIGLIVPPLNRVRERLFHPDPLLPPELRPRWKRWLDMPVRLVSTSLATSLAAWLGSLPLIAWHFHMATPGSLLANLLIAPLSSVGLMSSLGSIICGDWLPMLTEWFNHASWFWMILMVWLSEWFASLPGAWFYVRKPPWLLAALYYLALGGVLSGSIFAARWRIWTCAGALALAAAWAGLAIAWRDEIRLTVLPVRGGAVFVDEPGRNRDMLVDCGDAAAFDTVIKPFLRSQGVNRLASLLLSHGDVAHAGGAETVREHFRVRQIVVNPAPFRSRVYRDFLAALPELPVRTHQVLRGDTAGSWTVLHPGPEDRFSQGAHNAMVLRGTLHGARVLMVSDLGRIGQRTLLARERDLRAEVLIAGLSTAQDVLEPSLLEAVEPRLLIVACPEYPATAAPSRALRERLLRFGIPVIYTSDTGAAVLEFGRNGWRFWTMENRGKILTADQQESS